METLMCLMIFCIGFVVLYRRYYNITIPIIVYFSVVYFVKLFSVQKMQCIQIGKAKALPVWMHCILMQYL